MMEIPKGIHIVSMKPQRGKKRFYYARKKKRINGQSRVIWSLSLGTAEDIVRHYTDRRLDYIEFKPFAFGIPASFLAIAEKIDFFNTVDTAAQKKMINGALTTAQYVLAMMTGRATGPFSKAETGRWFADTFLELVWKPVHHLNTQNFNNHMDKLKPETVDKVTEAVGRKLANIGFIPSYILWDTTNFSTNIENFGDKELPKPGYAKDKRFDKNIVGTGIALTNDELPVFHSVYPGNENDVNLFKKSIDDIVTKLKRVYGAKAPMTLVFDKGNNSAKNIGAILENCHMVGGVSFDQVPDLLDVPVEQFRFIYRTNCGTEMKAYRTTRKLWGLDEFVVVVTFNSQTAKRQERTWRHAKEKIGKELPKLKEKFEKSGGRGRRMTVKGLTTEINRVIPKQYRAIYWWNINGNERKFEWKLLEEKEEDMKKKFGKNVIFTDLTKWDTRRIVKTYHSKWKMEKAFRWLHGELLIPIPPVFHGEDKRIRVHIFLCILALMFARLIAKEVKGVTVSDEKLLQELKELKVALLKDVNTNEVKLKVMEMNATQAGVFSTLRLDKYLKII